MHAQIVSAYSTVFALAIATRSPLPTPYSSASTAAYDATRPGQLAVRDGLVAEHEVGRVTVLLGRADHDVAHVARTLREDPQLLAEHLLLDQLERCARSAQHVPDVVGEQLVVAPPHRELEISGVGHAVSPPAR